VAADLAAQRWPDRTVALLDRSLFGRGATQHSGGHNHPFGYTPEQKILAAESVAYFDRLRQRFPQLPLRDCSLVGIVSKERAASVVDGYLRAGAQVDDAPPRELGSLGTVSLGAHQAMIVGAASAYGFPAAIADLLVRDLRSDDRIRCWEGVTVDGVACADGDIVLRTTCGRSVQARRALIAAGPWTLRLLSGEPALSAVRVKKVVAMHIELAPTLADPIVYFFDDGAYLLPVVEKGHWIYSFTSDEFDCEPEISRIAITERDRAIALSLLGRHLPRLVERCTSGRVFCDTYTLDRLPIVVQPLALPGAAVIAGCSGFGFRLAPAIARRALDRLALDEETALRGGTLNGNHEDSQV
jgi:glycine/D-amino acid oxidase-like deaminating enzyme